MPVKGYYSDRLLELSPYADQLIKSPESLQRWLAEVEPLALLRMALDCRAEVSGRRGVPRSHRRSRSASGGPEKILLFLTPVPY